MKKKKDARKKTPKRDIYAEVTAKIVAKLETGVVPWVRPWHSAPQSAPMNGCTGASYRGVNILLLWLEGYGDARWYSFRQAKTKGGSVRKGERGSWIVFYSQVEKKDDERREGEEKDYYHMVKHYTVFNHAQIEWDEAGGEEGKPVDPPPPLAEDLREAQALVDATQARISWGGSRACYSPQSDRIRMPEAEAFGSQQECMAVLLHELTHWTAHPSRLDRKLGKRFGDHAYAAEELIAEMGSAFLCAVTGVQGSLQHAEYLDHWIKVLKADKRAVFTAAAAAQRASDFLLDLKEKASMPLAS